MIDPWNTQRPIDPPKENLESAQWSLKSIQRMPETLSRTSSGTGTSFSDQYLTLTPVRVFLWWELLKLFNPPVKNLISGIKSWNFWWFSVTPAFFINLTYFFPPASSSLHFSCNVSWSQLQMNIPLTFCSISRTHCRAAAAAADANVFYRIITIHLCTCSHSLKTAAFILCVCVWVCSDGWPLFTLQFFFFFLVISFFWGRSEEVERPSSTSSSEPSQQG